MYTVLMDKKLDLYYENQKDSSKLIYTLGILWVQIVSKLDNILAQANLNTSKFNILMIIKHIGKEQGIQQNEISKRLLVTASNITKLLDKLEKDGMITRNAKENDRRVKLIKITDFASKLLDDIYPSYQHEIEKITQNMQNSDVQLLNQKLVEWLTIIK